MVFAEAIAIHCFYFRACAHHQKCGMKSEQRIVFAESFTIYCFLRPRSGEEILNLDCRENRFIIAPGFLI